MKKVIDLFNKKYGKELGVIDDSLTTSDIYKAYELISEICKDDIEIMERLSEVKLPEPKTPSEILSKIKMNHDMNNKNSGSSEWVSFSYTTTDDTRYNYKNIVFNDITKFIDSFEIGGRIHVLGNYYEDWSELSYIDLNFIMGSNISMGDEMSGDTYYYFETFGLANENVVFKLHITLIYGGGRAEITSAYLESYTDGTRNNKILDFNVIGVYFEPIPSINTTDLY